MVWGAGDGLPLCEELPHGTPPPPCKLPPLAIPPPPPGDRHFHVFLVNMYCARLCCPSALRMALHCFPITQIKHLCVFCDILAPKASLQTDWCGCASGR